MERLVCPYCSYNEKHFWQSGSFFKESKQPFVLKRKLELGKKYTFVEEPRVGVKLIGCPCCKKVFVDC